MLDTYTQIKQTFNSVNEFRTGQQKFKQLSSAIMNNFMGAKIFHPMDLPDYMIFEWVMFLAILNKKHEKVKAGAKETSEQVAQVMEKYREQIIARNNSNLQEFGKYKQEIIKCINFIEYAKYLYDDDKYKNLVYSTVLSICRKQQNKSFIWGNRSIKYLNAQIKNFGLKFGENVCYNDYDDGKLLSNQFETPNPNSIYILKAKYRYLILYSSEKAYNKSLMKIVQTNTVPVKDVQKIFLKQKQHAVDNLRYSQNQPANNSIINNIPFLSQIIPNRNKDLQTQSKIRQSQSSIPNNQIRDNQLGDSRSSTKKSNHEDSLILPTKVKCSKCDLEISQYDCLYWNYVYCCSSCLVDVNKDTSDLPKFRVTKFLKDRGLVNYNYSLPCPQCNHIIVIKNYNPASKPRLFQCNLCAKTICVKHRANIYNCFCYCNQCRIPTIYLQRLNINFCQYCRNRYCFKCKKFGSQFCACICKQCLGENSKGHQCVPACHSCNNKTTRLRICNNCGLFICYGCYYSALQVYKQGMIFPCGQKQFS